MSTFKATALITGGTSGLGYSTARCIAQQRPDWRILIASRNGAKAADKLNKELTKIDGRKVPNVFYLPLDCSSEKGVRQFIEEYDSAAHPPIQVLIFNAGVQIVSGLKYSDDGYEMTFATNHLGQALLLLLLQPHLSDDARILYTGSGLHRSTKEELYISAEQCAHPKAASPSLKYPKEGRKTYARSKLVNVLWLHALREEVREQGKKWTVAGFEPGLMPGTGLARDSSFALRFVWNYILPNLLFLLRRFIPNTYTPDQSGRVFARLALEDGLISRDDDETAYWQHKGAVPSAPASYNKDWQQDLWKWTLKALSVRGEDAMGAR